MSIQVDSTHTPKLKKHKDHRVHLAKKLLMVTKLTTFKLKKKILLRKMEQLKIAIFNSQHQKSHTQAKVNKKKDHGGVKLEH